MRYLISYEEIFVPLPKPMWCMIDEVSNLLEPSILTSRSGSDSYTICNISDVSYQILSDFSMIRLAILKHVW